MKRSKTAPETIGERLRKAREKAGLSVEDVAKKTKMSPRIVTALEEDQAVDRLSPVYVRSFLRMYARLVGLNEGAILQDFAGQSPPSPEEVTPLPVRTPEPLMAGSPAMPWMAWRPTKQQLAVAGIIAAVCVGLWGLAAAMKHLPRPRKQPAVARAQRPSPAAVKPAPRPKPAPAPRPAAVAAPAAVAVPANEPLKLQVTARERTWLRVTADGKVIFQNVLEKGKTEQWLAQESLSLWLANAGGVQLTLNGKSLGAPGRRGEVIKDLQITRSGMQVKR